MRVLLSDGSVCLMESATERMLTLLGEVRQGPCRVLLAPGDAMIQMVNCLGPLSEDKSTRLQRILSRIGDLIALEVGVSPC